MPRTTVWAPNRAEDRRRVRSWRAARAGRSARSATAGCAFARGGRGPGCRPDTLSAASTNRSAGDGEGERHAPVAISAGADGGTRQDAYRLHRARRHVRAHQLRRGRAPAAGSRAMWVGSVQDGQQRVQRGDRYTISGGPSASGHQRAATASSSARPAWMPSRSRWRGSRSARDPRNGARMAAGNVRARPTAPPPPARRCRRHRRTARPARPTRRSSPASSPAAPDACPDCRQRDGSQRAASRGGHLSPG